MNYLIGIDDTDNLQSRGTGYRARALGHALAEAGLGELLSVTRHQLLVHPAIPYTSHNSSACLLVSARDGVEELARFCAGVLLAESAPGSDAGLCLRRADAVGATVVAFGRRAKQEVVTQGEALDLAATEGCILQGLTGDGGGVIGALAAVGLCTAGDDGRYLWLPGLREMTGTITAGRLRRASAIHAASIADERPLPDDDAIELGDWVRPIRRGGEAILLVEPTGDAPGAWRVAARDLIKARSE